MKSDSSQTERSRRVGPTITAVAVAVVTAVAVTALTPLGEEIAESLFPTRADLVGTVVTEDDEVTGATVTVGDRSTTTDSGGVFALTDVPRGEHRLRIEHVAIRRHETKVVVSQDDERVDLGTIAVDPAYRLRHALRPYSAAFWLEGDDDAMRRATEATYRFPDAWRREPVTVRNGEHLCAVVFGQVHMTGANEVLDVTTLLAVGGQQLTLNGATPAPNRPAACVEDEPVIPEVTGLAADDAGQRLEEAGFEAVTAAEVVVDCLDHVDVVNATVPPAGTAWPPRQEVRIEIGRPSDFLDLRLRDPFPQNDRLFCD